MLARDALRRHAELLHDLARCGVACIMPRINAVKADLAEQVFEHGACGFRHIAPVPIGLIDLPAHTGVPKAVVLCDRNLSDDFPAVQGNRPVVVVLALVALKPVLQDLFRVLYAAVCPVADIARDRRVARPCKNIRRIRFTESAQDEPLGVKCLRPLVVRQLFAVFCPQVFFAAETLAAVEGFIFAVAGKHQPAVSDDLSAAGIFHRVAGADACFMQGLLCELYDLHRRLGRKAPMPAVIAQIVPKAPLLSSGFQVKTAHADQFAACLFDETEIIRCVRIVVDALQPFERVRRRFMSLIAHIPRHPLVAGTPEYSGCVCRSQRAQDQPFGF